jgi:cellulose biosynthesis protein BcsQ
VTVPIVAFFNNKGGVGKTSLVYHLSWMLSDLGRTVAVADLDPQANLTAAFLDEDDLEPLWDGRTGATAYGAIEPLLRGVGDIASTAPLIAVSEKLHLLPGDLALARFEDELSQQWPRCLDGEERSFRVLSAFWRLVQQGARAAGASLVLFDLGPNLGAINRSALVAADFLVIPLSPDLFSLQGLKNLGPTLRKWRGDWTERLRKSPASDLALPGGRIEPLGYVVMQHAVRLDRPVKAYDRWVQRIPEEYARSILGRADRPGESDGHRIGMVRHYRSLVPMAQEARKPMFHLTAADGAIGSHADAVQDARRTFEALAREIESRVQRMSLATAG